MVQNDRARGFDRIEIGVPGQRRFGPVVLVPAPADDWVRPRGLDPDGVAHHRLYLFDRGGAAQVQSRRAPAAESLEVNPGVVGAGKHDAVLEWHLLGVGAGELEDLRVGARRQDGVATNGNRLHRVPHRAAGVDHAAGQE